MADSRMSSFLPTIKCSMCARDIEISMMGEHICSTAPETTPPLEMPRNFRTNPYGSQGRDSFSKTSRLPPPRVDTHAANHPYRKDSLTPISTSSESRSISPITPNDGGRSPYVTRNMQPPSPDILSSNLDSAFPPFPTKQVSIDNSYRGRYPPHNYAEADPMYAPVSPRNATAGGLLKRMNTITPGPFDVNRSRSRGRAGRAESENPALPPPIIKDDVEMASTSYENRGHMAQRSISSPGHSRSSTASSVAPPIPPARVPRLGGNGGYGGFGPPGLQQDEMPELLRPDNRSQTFPISGTSGSTGLLRSPSQPAVGSYVPRPSTAGPGGSPVKNETYVRESPPRQGRRPSVSKPPPRGSSLTGRRFNPDGTLPLPLNVDLAAEFGSGNPYHTPSVSQSSNEAGDTPESKASSRSSPPSAKKETGRSRKRSDELVFDTFKSDVNTSITNAEANGKRPNQRLQYQEVIASPPKRLNPSLLAPDTYSDPAIQSGRSTPSSQASNNEPVGNDSEPVRPRRRPATSKGDCKGCGLPIKGKSVSSADGRLTGKYHKDCFVCKTCSAPFTTSIFYVLNDLPYCQRHYHELNGSVCQNCERGIEGQYLETERRQKFHPNCLTCTDCRRILRDDYFEMNGKVYCERDAFRRAQQRTFLGPGQLGSNRMERRTTRLMFT